MMKPSCISEALMISGLPLLSGFIIPPAAFVTMDRKSAVMKISSRRGKMSDFPTNREKCSNGHSNSFPRLSFVLFHLYFKPF